MDGWTCPFSNLLSPSIGSPLLSVVFMVGCERWMKKKIKKGDPARTMKPWGRSFLIFSSYKRKENVRRTKLKIENEREELKAGFTARLIYFFFLSFLGSGECFCLEVWFSPVAYVFVLLLWAAITIKPRESIIITKNRFIASLSRLQELHTEILFFYYLRSGVPKRKIISERKTVDGWFSFYFSVFKIPREEAVFLCLWPSSLLKTKENLYDERSPAACPVFY